MRNHSQKNLGIRLRLEIVGKINTYTSDIKEFRCYEAKIEESEKGRQPPGVEPRTPGLSRQCSATELRQPDNHQPPQSSICTAQVVLNASVTHPAATQYVPLGVDWKILSIRKEPMLSGLLTLNAQSILRQAGNKGI